MAPDARYLNSGVASYTGAGKNKAKLVGHYLRRLSTTRYDQIIFGHVYLSPLAFLARLFNPAVKIGVISYGIEVWQPLKRSQRMALLRADVVLAISDYTKEEVSRHNNIPPEKITVFPCTLDPYWKESVPVAESESTPPMILSVARMKKEDRYKGIDNVIRSLPNVVRSVGPVEYTVVGQGDDVPRLKALAAGLGVSRYVKFMGGMSDAELRDLYQHCSLFVMPSKKEGFGIVFLEAMAYGKPVIGGAHGGAPSVVKDGETGLLVESSDVGAIGNFIIRLLADKKMRHDFGEAGHRRLLGEFTFEKFERNLSEVFRLLA
jgi:glycosyltransferase involved in cell wall biosynthesis